MADNPEKRRIPAISGIVIVLSLETGRPVGMLDGMIITNIRTGAAGAIGAKHLAREGSSNILVVGTGAQGRVQVQGLTKVLPGIEVVRVAGRDPEKLSRFVVEMSALYPRIHFQEIPMEGLQEAVSLSDVVVTCTPSHEPFIRAEWVRPGTHINAIGADFPGKQELDEHLLPLARLVVDSKAQSLEIGEFQTAFKKGLSGYDAPDQEHLSSRSGRVNDEEITILTPPAYLQDIVTANRTGQGPGTQDRSREPVTGWPSMG